MYTYMYDTYVGKFEIQIPKQKRVEGDNYMYK